MDFHRLLLYFSNNFQAKLLISPRQQVDRKVSTETNKCVLKVGIKTMKLVKNESYLIELFT